MSELNPNLYQCRLCLKQTPTRTRINILGGDFPKMLDILTSIKVSENDGLPKYSCTKCALDVKTALIVKKRIIKAHKILAKSLEIGKTKSIKLLPVITVTLGDSPTCPTSDVRLSQSEIDHNSEETVSTNFAVDKGDNVECFTETKVKSENISIVYNEVSEGTSQTSNFSSQNVNGNDDAKHPILRCEKCDESFPDKYSYSLHSSKHKKTKCKFCNRFIRSDNYKRHLIIHTGDPTDCQFCGITCKNVDALRFHVFYNHKQSTHSYICDECGKNFRTRSKFNFHQKKVHLRLRNFKCELCGKTFFTNADLNKHINMHHKKLRPYMCEFCGTGYSSVYALTTHKRQHTNEKPYKCQHCEEGFRQKVSMRAHMKSKHGIEEPKDYLCDLCDKGFATDIALEIHRRHHAHKKCEMCPKIFVEEVLLKKHLEEHSIIKNEEPDIKEEDSDIK